jgi:Domain of unknown function (DUF1844)
MAEDKETGFKITDRRKFNPDGTPRDAEAEEVAGGDDSPQSVKAHAIEDAPESEGDSTVGIDPTGEAPSSNVVSFESAKKKDRIEPPAPVDPHPDIDLGTEETVAPEVGAAEQAYNEARGPQSHRMPEASFLGLVNMLAVEAAMALGLIRTPEGAPPVDLEAARHLIDLLGMLQQKTRGNLTAEEDNMLENVLADLRVQFVAMSSRR